MSERLHKLLAQHGLGSRREIEKWMQAGRILLNNQPAELGARYQPGDRVVIDGKDISARLRVIPGVSRALIFHKAHGQPIQPNSEQADASVMESLPAVRGARWLMVNTMQAGDSGLLLLTTDGALANALRRRSESIPSAYMARVLIPFAEFDLATIPKVVHYDNEVVEFDAIESVEGEGANRWFRVDAHRAHRRAAVRELFESRGLKVSRVTQVQYAGLDLPRDLPRGRHRILSDAQLQALYALADLSAPVPPPPPKKKVSRPAPDRRGGGRRPAMGTRRTRPATGTQRTRR